MTDIINQAIEELKKKYEALCKEVFKEEYTKCPPLNIKLGGAMVGEYVRDKYIINVEIAPQAIMSNYDLALEYAESVIYHELLHAYLDKIAKQKYNLTDEEINKITEFYATLKQAHRYPDSFKAFRCEPKDELIKALIKTEVSYYGGKLIDDSKGSHFSDLIFDWYFMYNISLSTACMEYDDILKDIGEMYGRNLAKELVYLKAFHVNLSEKELIESLKDIADMFRKVLDERYLKMLKDAYKKYI